MALPASGQIDMGQIRTELNLTGPISLGDSAARTLAGKPSGAISLSDFYGKDNMGWVWQTVAKDLGVLSGNPTLYFYLKLANGKAGDGQYTGSGNSSGSISGNFKTMTGVPAKWYMMINLSDYWTMGPIAPNQWIEINPTANPAVMFSKGFTTTQDETLYIWTTDNPAQGAKGQVIFHYQCQR